MKYYKTKTDRNRNALPIGTRIGEYRIDKVLGHGGFGITYYVIDVILDRAYAIKEYLPNEIAVRERDASIHVNSTQDKASYIWGLKRFLLEAKNLASFNHPNIVSAVRLFEANNTAYLVMKYEEGVSLEDYLKNHGPTLTEKIIRRIFLHILDGLRAVHEIGLLHRDIKPSNIYLCKHSSPILIDFGAARYEMGERSRSYSVVLTPGFAPFEQYSSRGNQGPWTDLYGIGASIYKCMSGKPPVNAQDRALALSDNEEDPYQKVATLIAREYSKGLADLVDAAMSFKASSRPQSVAEFQQLLR